MATANVVQTSISGGHSNALAIQGDGAFLPKLDTASRLALTLGTPDKGLTVYDTTLTTLCIWTGAAWEFVSDSSQVWVNVKDFGAKGDGVTNDTTAIQAAIDYAYSLFLGYITTPYGPIRKGGNTVYFPAGTYVTTSTILFDSDITLQGAGRFSTIIQSSYDGILIRNRTPSAPTYDTKSMGIKDLSVQGDKTKANQIGIAILRDWQGTYSNVTVANCGSHGWRLYQCIQSQLTNIEALQCGGNGLLITDGIDSWENPIPSNLPSNNIDVYAIHAYGCDGAGIKLGRIGTSSAVMGCQFFGGSSEYNYASSPAGVGYNVEIIDTASAVPNAFYSLWVEDIKVLAHVYINCADPSEAVCFNKLKHFSNGAASYPQKAIIVQKGRLLLDSPVGSANLYKTYLGSNAPFQLNKPDGIIYANNILGSSLSVQSPQIVDETGASSGFINNIKVNNFNNFWGFCNFNIDFGQRGPSFYQEGQSFAYSEFSTFYKGLLFGSGLSNADAGLTRISADVLGMMAGDSFQVAGLTGETLKYASGTANGSVATTLGSVGPVGSTAGNPLGWLRVNVGGTDRFVPYW